MNLWLPPRWRVGLVCCPNWRAFRGEMVKANPRRHCDVQRIGSPLHRDRNPHFTTGLRKARPRGPAFRGWPQGPRRAAESPGVKPTVGIERSGMPWDEQQTDSLIAAGDVVLRPVSAAAAAKLVARDFSQIVAGEGWPHADSLDGLRMVAGGYGLGWLITLGDEVVGSAVPTARRYSAGAGKPQTGSREAA